MAYYKYAPYGEQDSYSGTYTTDYQFTGKEANSDIGLTYFGARFYDPEVGRFLTVDPKKDGMNWFAYCRDNPLKYFDPNGLEARSAKFCVSFPTNAVGIDGDAGYAVPVSCPGEVSVTGTMVVETSGNKVNVTVDLNISFTSQAGPESNIKTTPIVSGIISIWDDNGNPNPFTLTCKGTKDIEATGVGNKHYETTVITSQSVVEKKSDIISVNLTLRVDSVVSEGWGIQNNGNNSQTVVSTIQVNEPGGGDEPNVHQSYDEAEH